MQHCGVQVVQRAIALEHGLMTPTQLLLAATFGSDDAFAISSGAEPYDAAIEADLGLHIKDGDIKRLYAPRPTDGQMNLERTRRSRGV